MKVQDELGIAVADGPLPPLLGLPPVSLLVQILVQDPLPAGGVREHHHTCGGLEQQEQSSAPQPARTLMLHDGGERADFKLRTGEPGDVQQTELVLEKQKSIIGPLLPIC